MSVFKKIGSLFKRAKKFTVGELREKIDMDIRVYRGEDVGGKITVHVVGLVSYDGRALIREEKTVTL